MVGQPPGHLKQFDSIEHAQIRCVAGLEENSATSQFNHSRQLGVFLLSTPGPWRNILSLFFFNFRLFCSTITDRFHIRINLNTDRYKDRMIESIQTDHAPQAIGPYSQAIKANGMVFASGQIPLDPTTMQLVEGDIRLQTDQVLNNLKAVLAAAGSSLEQVVKTTVYLADMNDFAAMNEVYATFFNSTRPARSTVQAARLPRDVRVEIDVIALV